MKSEILYASLIIMLFASTVTFGEVVWDSDYYTYGDAEFYNIDNGNAMGYAEDNWGYFSGWIYAYSTEGDFFLDYCLYNHVTVELELWSGEYNHGYSYADASVSGPYDSDELTAYAAVGDSGYGGKTASDWDCGYGDCYCLTGNIEGGEGSSEGIYFDNFLAVSAWSGPGQDYAGSWGHNCSRPD